MNRKIEARRPAMMTNEQYFYGLLDKIGEDIWSLQEYVKNYLPSVNEEAASEFQEKLQELDELHTKWSRTEMT